MYHWILKIPKIPPVQMFPTCQRNPMFLPTLEDLVHPLNLFPKRNKYQFPYWKYFLPA
jgi:hypothetical protein